MDFKAPHAMVVPAAGQSDAASCMLLATSLASLGFEVSFVYLSSEYAKIRTELEPLMALADPAQRAGPAQAGNGGSGRSRGDDCNATRGGDSKDFIHMHVVHDGLGADDARDFFSYTDATKENLFRLINQLQEQGTTLTCLISDVFAPWTADVAERARIPLVNYLSCSAFGYILMPSIALLFAQGVFPEKGSSAKWKRDTPLMLDHIPGLPPFSSELYPHHVRFADAPPGLLISFTDQISASLKQGERMLIHTMSELEPDAFRALHMAGINAYGVGPLLQYAVEHRHPVPSSQEEENPNQLQNIKAECISWLDMQAESSVMYVAFGTFVSFPPEEVQELACGLEASGIPFLWVVRGDSGSDVGLPVGFGESVRGKGMITNWAPQVEVLGHGSIGGFLTHCGWSSIMESLWEGVPMLCCPGGADQRMNSHYICNEWGVGLELERTTSGGGLERRNVERGVRCLMHEEEGGQARTKAKEMMQLCRKACQEGGLSFSNLQKFYQDMKSLCTH